MPEPIRIEYFTDPYCAWCWAFEPRLEALLASERVGLTVRYLLLPLIEDLEKSGSTAEQVAVAWERISRVTGAPINAGIWRKDHPNSTLPACRGAKAAEEQGADAEGRFLRALRPMLMTGGRVADHATLLEAAGKAGLDPEKFERSLASPELDQRIEADKAYAKENAATSTPSVILRNSSGDKVQIQGPRDLELFRKAIAVLRQEKELGR